MNFSPRMTPMDAKETVLKSALIRVICGLSPRTEYSVLSTPCLASPVVARPAKRFAKPVTQGIMAHTFIRPHHIRQTTG